MGWEVLLEQSLGGGGRTKFVNNMEWQNNAVVKGEK